MTELEQLEEKIIDVQEKYWDAEAELRDLYQQKADINCPFLIGDELEGKRRETDKKKRKVVLLKVGYTWVEGNLEVVVTDIKKDGDLSAKPYKLSGDELGNFKKTGHREVPDEEAA